MAWMKASSARRPWLGRVLHQPAGLLPESVLKNIDDPVQVSPRLSRSARFSTNIWLSPSRTITAGDRQKPGNSTPEPVQRRRPPHHAYRLVMIQSPIRLDRFSPPSWLSSASSTRGALRPTRHCGNFWLPVGPQSGAVPFGSWPLLGPEDRTGGGPAGGAGPFRPAGRAAGLQARWRSPISPNTSRTVCCRSRTAANSAVLYRFALLLIAFLPKGPGAFALSGETRR